MAVEQVLLQLTNSDALLLHVLQKWQPLFVLKLLRGISSATVVQLLLEVRVPLRCYLFAGALDGFHDALDVDVLVEHLVDQPVLQLHLGIDRDGPSAQHRLAKDVLAGRLGLGWLGFCFALVADVSICSIVCADVAGSGFDLGWTECCVCDRRGIRTPQRL